MEWSVGRGGASAMLRANLCLNGQAAPVKTAIVGPNRITTLDALKLVACQKLAPERCVDPIVDPIRVKLYSREGADVDGLDDLIDGKTVLGFRRNRKGRWLRQIALTK